METLKKLTDNKKYLFLFLLLLSGIGFGSAIKGSFFYDDMFLIVHNEYIKSFSHFFDWFTSSSTAGAGKGTGNLYRPLATMMNAIIFQIFGLKATIYHSFNIILHALNALLVFTFLKKLSFKRIGCFLAALLFLLHPIQAETVSYIAGLPDIMYALFLLLGLNLYLKTGVKRKHLHIKTIGILMILSMLSKEPGVILFPLAILIDMFRWKDYDKQEKHIRKRWLIELGIIAIAFVILKFTALSFTGNIGLSSQANAYSENLYLRLYVFFGAIVEYLKLIFYPVHLYFEKGASLFSESLTLQGYLGLVLLVLGLAGSLFSFKRRKIFFFAYFWFLISLAPASGIIPQNALFTEHWLYIPLIGFLVLFSDLFDHIPKKFIKYFTVATFAILIALTIRTIDRSAQWANPSEFFENELKYSDEPEKIHNLWGTTYLQKEAYQSAIKQFETAIAINDTNPKARLNNCLAYYTTNEFTLAQQNCLRTIELNPNQKEAYMLLYNLAVKANQTTKAKKYLEIIKGMGK